jgi:hypothetical protein
MRWVMTMYWFVAIAGCNEVWSPPSEMVVRVVERVDGNERPIAGAEICWTDSTNCVLTDALGQADLALPSEPKFSYTITKEGYESLLRADIVDQDYDVRPTYRLFGNEATTDWMDSLESQYPMVGTGSVAVSVGFEGATFDLVDATGKGFYEVDGVTVRLACDDAPGEPCLDATTAQGQGGFVEVAPGEFQIELGGTAADRCFAGQAWPGDDPNRISVPIREGFFTLADVVCTAAK